MRRPHQDDRLVGGPAAARSLMPTPAGSRPGRTADARSLGRTADAPAGPRPLGRATGALVGMRRPEPEAVGAAQVGGLRVLGAAPVAAPAGGFDPAGALIATPRPTAPALIATPRAATTPARVGSLGTVGAAPAATAGRRATPPRMRPEPAAPASPPASPPTATPGPRPDPATRWRAAVAARPLESPRPFPASLHPLVAAVAGSAQRATYTTGPATRHALAAAGAHGATTGSVVHLPTAPRPAPGALLGIVAHELAHARQPVTRPRFLLGIPDGGADADERNALAVGRRFQSMASGGGDAIRAGIVNELPVGGLGGGAAGIAGQARGALGGGDLPDLGGSAPQVPGIGGATPSWSGADLSNAAGGAATEAMGAVSDAGAPASPGGTPGGGAAGGAAAPSNVDMEQLADLLEQRLLKQIERRGGRYAGVF
jgi:hypothetical protein